LLSSHLSWGEQVHSRSAAMAPDPWFFIEFQGPDRVQIINVIITRIAEKLYLGSN